MAGNFRTAGCFPADDPPHTWSGASKYFCIRVKLANFGTLLLLWHRGWRSMIESAKMDTERSLRGSDPEGAFFMGKTHPLYADALQIMKTAAGILPG